MNKVAIITGAASGIGLALSFVSLQKGLTLVMVDKNEPQLKLQEEQLRADFPEQILTYTCDVTQEQEVKQLAKTVEKNLGRVDQLYNNAGIIGSLTPIWELQKEELRQVLDVNLHGMLNMIRAFTPLLFKQDFNSHIINMASFYALCSSSQVGAYSMSKHAVLALSESLYFDLNRLGKPVDVSVVFPSFTDTALLSPTSEKAGALQHYLNGLLTHSRPALEVATEIVQEVEQKKFYLFPDKEVKGYCEERTQAILAQKHPHKNKVEQLMGSLIKRAG